MRWLFPLLLLLAALSVTWLLVHQAPDVPAGSADVHVLVLGPDGATLLEGTVRADPAHPLGALRAITAGTAWTPSVRHQGGIGGCGAYVEAVGAYQEEGVEGWLYDVRPAGGDWTVRPPDAADCHHLSDGDAVRWYYGTY